MLAQGASIISIMRGSFLQSAAFQYVPSPTCKNCCWAQMASQIGLGGLVFFTNVGAHDAFLGVPGTPQIPQKSLRAVWICFRKACRFQRGFGKALWRSIEKRRSNDAGSAAALHGKARATAAKIRGVARFAIADTSEPLTSLPEAPALPGKSPCCRLFPPSSGHSGPPKCHSSDRSLQCNWLGDHLGHLHDVLSRGCVLEECPRCRNLGDPGFSSEKAISQ